MTVYGKLLEKHVDIGESLNEETYNDDAVENVIEKSWKKVFPKSSVKFGRRGKFNPVSAVFDLRSEREIPPGEFGTGALDLMMFVNNKGSDRDEMDVGTSGEFHITPKKKNIRFSVEKLDFDDFKTGDIQEFEKTILKYFEEIKKKARKFFKDGQFSYLGEEEEKALKSKL